MRQEIICLRCDSELLPKNCVQIYADSRIIVQNIKLPVPTDTLAIIYLSQRDETKVLVIWRS